MIASQLIDTRLLPLTVSMSMEEAEQLFADAQVFYLPLISEKKEVLGIVSLDCVLSALSEGKKEVSDLQENLNLTPVLPASCHYYEILKIFSQSEADILPVADELNHYQGCVTLHNITEQASSLLSVQYTGAIVVLETDTKNYSLAEIVRIIESNDAKVLGLEVAEVPHSDKLHIHLKLNTGILRPVLASLERFGYTVFAHFMRQDIQDDDTEERYRHLLSYLDLE